MITENKFLSNINAILKKKGFQMRSKIWYRDVGYLLHIVNFQKSQYGNQYYINCGIVIKEMEKNSFPREYHAHIRFRAPRGGVGSQNGHWTWINRIFPN